MEKTLVESDDLTLLSTTDAARMLSLSPQTLRNWRARRIGPRFIRAGSVAYYPKKAIKEYIEAYENLTRGS